MNLSEHRRRLLAIGNTKGVRHEGFTGAFDLVRDFCRFWFARRKGHLVSGAGPAPVAPSGPKKAVRPFTPTIPAPRGNRRMN